MKRPPFYFSNNSKISKINLATLSWKIQKSHFSTAYSYILQIIYVISKCYHLTHPHLKNVTALPHKMLNFHLTEGSVAFHHTVLKVSQCRNKTLSQLVRIADWHTIHALLQYPNSAVPASSSLSLEQNSTDNITEACC